LIYAQPNRAEGCLIFGVPCLMFVVRCLLSGCREEKTRACEWRREMRRKSDSHKYEKASFQSEKHSHAYDVLTERKYLIIHKSRFLGSAW
jgi:hypothetical protein